MALDSLPRLQLSEDGSIDGAPDSSLTIGHIGNVDVDRHGNLYLFDSREFQILVFSSDGQLLRRIGRQGDGPVQFGAGTVIGVRGDTVWARDTSSSVPRMFLFDRRGELLSTGVDTSKRFRAEVRQSPAVPVRFVAIGKTPRHPLPNPSPDHVLVQESRGGRVFVERKRPTSAEESSVQVTRTSVTGDTVFTRTLRYSPVRYSVDLLDSIVARNATAFGIRSASDRAGTVSVDALVDLSAAHALIRTRMAFPDYQTPVRDLHIGADLGIWLAREEDARGATTWSILDAAGNPRGWIELPPRVKLLWSSGDTIWTQHPEKDDVPSLVRYRISMSEDGSRN